MPCAARSDLARSTSRRRWVSERVRGFGKRVRLTDSRSASASRCANRDKASIDVQTLLPFDIDGRIVESLRKTGRVVFVDEDVPGGATGYMMQQVLDLQGGYYELDSPPRAISAKPHRPAYGSDGDYFSKPNREEIFRAVYDLMHDADPQRYPKFY